MVSHQTYDSFLGLQKDTVEALRECGHSVDFVSILKPLVPIENVYSLYDCTTKEYSSIKNNWFVNFLRKIKFVRNLYKGIFFQIPDKVLHKGIHFHYIDDAKPYIESNVWIDKIPDKKYDFIIFTFFGGFITFKTVEDIYNHYKCPILITAMDMHPMTGGCFYFKDCTGFKNECRNCIAQRFTKRKNQPHLNYCYKKRLYNFMPIGICGNSYMVDFFMQSKLFRKDQCFNIGVSINSDLFRPLDKVAIREEFGLNKDAFILFAGAQNVREKRKGMGGMIKAIELFRKRNPTISIVVVLAGNTFGYKFRIRDVEVKEVGYLSLVDMVKMYSATDVFLSPSIDDAGPSMVNQAIMCGTPVVAFNIGVARDIVIKDLTGYIANREDYTQFSDGITYIYETQKKGVDYTTMCRQFAVENFSSKVIAQKKIDCYIQLKTRHAKLF